MPSNKIFISLSEMFKSSISKNYNAATKKAIQILVI